MVYFFTEYFVKKDNYFICLICLLFPAWQSKWKAILEKAVPGPENIDKRLKFVGQINQNYLPKNSAVMVRSRKFYVVRKFSRNLGVFFLI